MAVIKKIIPSEDDECYVLADYLRQLQNKKKINTFGHIANETSYRQAQKNQLMGLAIGFPDYIVVAPDKLIFIEMKRTKGSKTYFEQKVWKDELNKVGNVFSEICYGFNEAKAFIDEMLR